MKASEIRKEAREKLSGRWGKAAIITLVYLLIMFVIIFVAGLLSIVGSIILVIIEIPISYGIAATFMRLKRGEDVSVTNFLTEGFSQFGKSWSVTLNRIKKLLIPIIITIICWVVSFVGGLGKFLIVVFFASAYLYGGIISGENLSTLWNGATDLIVKGTGVFSALGIIGLIAACIATIYTAIKSLYYSLSMYVLKDNEDMSGSEIVEKSEELMQGNRWNLFWLTLTFIGWMIVAAILLGIGYLWLIPYVQIAQVIFYEERAEILNAKPEEEKDGIAE